MRHGCPLALQEMLSARLTQGKFATVVLQGVLFELQPPLLTRQRFFLQPLRKIFPVKSAFGDDATNALGRLIGFDRRSQLRFLARKSFAFPPSSNTLKLPSLKSSESFGGGIERLRALSGFGS